MWPHRPRPAPPLALVLALAVAAAHTAFYIVLAVIFAGDAIAVPEIAKPALLLAGACTVMAVCLALTGTFVARGRRAARAPLLVLFIVEVMAYLVTIGNFAWWVSVLGLLAAAGIWGLLQGATRAYLGVADRPTKFD